MSNKKNILKNAYRILISVAVIALILVYRIYYLQSGSFSRRGASLTRNIPRGILYDNSGNIMAVSRKKHSLFLNPARIKNREKVMEFIYSFYPDESLRIAAEINSLARKILIKAGVTENDLHQAALLREEAVYYEMEYERNYPFLDSASNLLGFVAKDGTGSSGIELSLNSRLYENQNVYLTIDSLIQREIEKIIDYKINDYGAASIFVTVMDPNTGQITALAQTPRFNYLNLEETPDILFSNLPVTKTYEPGSVFKVIALASFLQNERKEILREEYYCGGSIKIYDETIRCASPHGIQNISDIIKNSCNVGMARAVDKISRNDFYKTVRDFGFGMITDVNMPGEAPGIFRRPNQWSGLTKYVMAIGYEIGVTQIQLAQAISAIANGGDLMRPMLIEKITDSKDNVLIEYRALKVREVIPEWISDFIKGTMALVVKEGTGRRADPGFIDVAGKTGTARKVDLEKGGYYENKYIASFAGFYPIKNPKYVIVITVDDPDPEIEYQGGIVAATIFKDIINIIEAKGRSYTTYLEEQSIPDSSIKRMDFYESEIKKGIMPDFRGLSLRNILNLFKDEMDRVEIIGNGFVENHYPPAGRQITADSVIVFNFKEMSGE